MLWIQQWLQCAQDMWYMLYTTPTRHMIPSHWLPIHCALTAPINTLPVETTALLVTRHAKVVGKRVTGEQNAEAVTPLVHKCPVVNPISKIMKRGENHKLPKPKQKRPPHKDLFVAAMDYGMVGDAPKGDDHWQHQFPAVQWSIHSHQTASSKGTASVCVKIDTGSGGNILPLCLFQQLHLKQTSPADLPIGLYPVQTKLTAYNGSPIPLYGILHGPIL